MIPTTFRGLPSSNVGPKSDSFAAFNEAAANRGLPSIICAVHIRRLARGAHASGVVHVLMLMLINKEGTVNSTVVMIFVIASNHYWPLVFAGGASFAFSRCWKFVKVGVNCDVGPAFLSASSNTATPRASPRVTRALA